MSTRPAQAGIAGACFLVCGLMVAMAYAMTLIRVYGPVVREFIHWLVTPQFCIGALAMATALGLIALAAARSD